LVRLAGKDSNTLLLDANTDSSGADNKSRFHNSFLNVGNKMTFGAPINVELTVMSNAGSGLNVRITRTELLQKAKEEKLKKAQALKKKQEAEDAEILRKAKEEAEKNNVILPTNSAGKVIVEQSKA